MSFWSFKKKIYPLLVFVVSIFFIVFGLVMARNENFIWFLLGAYVWLFIFGCKKGCLHMIFPFIVAGGIFGVIAYFAYGRDFTAALAMVNRFGAVFLAIALGMSIEPIDMTRNLSTLKAPRGVTLGMLIATSFPPVLKAEKQRVREAMKTRGAGSILNPKIFYRAFLVPFVMRLVNISDTLSLSVETRGFSLEKVPYTVYKKKKNLHIRHNLYFRTCRRRDLRGGVMNAIELKNVNFSYDGKTNILENVNIALSYGEVNLVSGHSGEGKSTLLYIISGIIPNITDGKLSGEVLINGEDVKGKKLGEVCRKVGVVLQNADEQIIQKTVEDEIAFGCENLAFPPEKISKQIDTVCRLMKLEKSWLSRKLSGGQKQRLITASTLAMGQKIVILDEPLANLDTAGAEMLMSTLKSLAKAGYCIIVIEHRLDVVLPFVDKVFHVGNRNVNEITDRENYLKEQSTEIEDTCSTFSGTLPAFSLSDVAFFVKDRDILNGVTFDILKGSRAVLLGENGCGKTTLLRLISRLEKPTRGVILQNIDDKFGQKSKQSKKWYKKVGVVYQNPDYQLFMQTVEKEIKFGAKSDEYADEIAEKFGIKHLYARHPQSLSEGQKRRVSIAAVVATNPEVLILDEPTVGQDYKGLCEMVEVLNRIHEETHNTMITVTHDKRCAAALCDRSVWIKDGKTYKTGDKQLIDEFFTIR